MKHLSCLLVTLVLLAPISIIHAVGPGDIAPPFVGTNLVDGKTVEFPALLNSKPAVVVFWATWCPYCKAFMPYAKDIQADYADAGVQIVTLNSKERGRGDPKAYVDSLDFPMFAIAQADAIGEAYSISFIPRLLVVDGEGKVVYRRRSTDLPAGKTVSAQWADEVRQVLDKLVR